MPEEMTEELYDTSQIWIGSLIVEDLFNGNGYEHCEVICTSTVTSTACKRHDTKVNEHHTSLQIQACTVYHNTCMHTMHIHRTDTHTHTHKTRGHTSELVDHPILRDHTSAVQ